MRGQGRGVHPYKPCSLERTFIKEPSVPMATLWCITKLPGSCRRYWQEDRAPCICQGGECTLSCRMCWHRKSLYGHGRACGCSNAVVLRLFWLVYLLQNAVSVALLWYTSSCQIPLSWARMTEPRPNWPRTVRQRPSAPALWFQTWAAKRRRILRKILSLDKHANLIWQWEPPATDQKKNKEEAQWIPGRLSSFY